MWILRYNSIITTAILTMLISQALKPLIILVFDHNFKLSMLKSTGGMPSSHAALVSSLTTSIAIKYGMDSGLFAISLAISLIIVHDAMGVRQEAGKQAAVLNQWSKILSETYGDDNFRIDTLKTLLGHSFSQVTAGILLGIGSGFLFMNIFS